MRLAMSRTHSGKFVSSAKQDTAIHYTTSVSVLQAFEKEFYRVFRERSMFFLMMNEQTRVNRHITNDDKTAAFVRAEILKL